MRVALIHYWLLGNRGGEKVLEALLDLFPQGELFTNVYAPERVSKKISSKSVHTTFIHHLPGVSRFYQYYLPLMPMALRRLDLSAYDLVISSESGPAKGVRVPKGVPHVCYVHSPMRYVWDMYDSYVTASKGLRRCLAPFAVNFLRNWDVRSAAKVDYLIANSQYVAARIKRFWRREATVIYPPVNTSNFSVSESVEDFYLVVGQLVPYKRTDLAVDAFNQNGKRLVIIGTGECLNDLRKRARSNVEFLGWQPDEFLARYYRRCKALIFPGEEDFGIVPIEAMASGRPVIAFGQGGAVETVKEGLTGTFFHEQTPGSLNDAILRLESDFQKYNPAVIRRCALRFDLSRFNREFVTFVESVMG